MTDDPQDFECDQCHKSFNERQLVSKTQTVDSCPFCRKVLRTSDGSTVRRHDAIVMEDVSTIEAWLDNYAKANGLTVSPGPAPIGGKTKTWVLAMPGKWQCQGVYDPSRANFVGVRLVATDSATRATNEDKAKLQTICADHGVQPCGHVKSDMSGSEYVWGASVYLSTDTLCDELFPPVLKRLAGAMQDASGRF